MLMPEMHEKMKGSDKWIVLLPSTRTLPPELEGQG